MLTPCHQKIHSNAYISRPTQRGLLHHANAFWRAFLVKGLGLVPIVQTSAFKYCDAHGAFQLLRVRAPSLTALCSMSPLPQVRNRFAAHSPLGGYRDINVKIRVGFKSDAESGRPLFCPVYVDNAAAAAVEVMLMIHCRKMWDQADVKTMVSHPAPSFNFLLNFYFR